MESIPSTKVRQMFSEVTGKVQHAKQRVILTKHGRPVAALVPYEDLEALLNSEEPAAAPAEYSEPDRFAF